jgi:DnaK suppressor protein
MRIKLVDSRRVAMRRDAGSNSAMDQSQIRTVLNNERSAVLESIRRLTGDFDEVVANSEASNADDEHDPEGATIAYERTQIAARIEEARASLEAVNRAMAQLSDGHYGECSVCGSPISPERLEALPTTDVCIRCAVLRTTC